MEYDITYHRLANEHLNSVNQCVQLCGKRVKVFEAEPKCNSPHDDARQDRVQNRPPSKSPQLGSETPPTGTTGISSPSPFPDIERNPHFLAFLSDRGINMQQVKESVVLNRQLQHFFSNYMQEIGGPPNSMTQAVGDEWVRCFCSFLSYPWGIAAAWMNSNESGFCSIHLAHATTLETTKLLRIFPQVGYTSGTRCISHLHPTTCSHHQCSHSEVADHLWMSMAHTWCPWNPRLQCNIMTMV